MHINVSNYCWWTCLEFYLLFYIVVADWSPLKIIISAVILDIVAYIARSSHVRSEITRPQVSKCCIQAGTLSPFLSKIPLCNCIPDTNECKCKLVTPRLNVVAHFRLILTLAASLSRAYNVAQNVSLLMLLLHFHFALQDSQHLQSHLTEFAHLWSGSLQRLLQHGNVCICTRGRRENAGGS